tara:strand:+ start:686 stop:1552 length:867 start_codon:yes stop_codon:yes gene_type:complete
MAHKMKYPKGKGFPFKKEDSPLKHYIAHGYHDHDDPTDTHYDGGPDWDGQIGPDDEHLNPNNTDTPSTDDPGTVNLYNGDYDGGGSDGDVPDWVDRWTSGEPLVKPSITGDEESILTKQAREREESGAHPWARGGQANPSEVVYPWGDDDGGGETEDNFVKPNPDYTDQWGNPVSPVRDPKPNIDSFGNVVSSIHDSPNVDSFGNPASPVNPGDKPDSTSTTSDPSDRPDTSPVVTDIFGNDVSALNERGRDVPFSTVTTPGTFNLNRTGGSTKGNRGFIQPRNYKKA